MKYKPLYRQLNDTTALRFLDYYEKQMFQQKFSLPLDSILQFNRGKLALKSDYYECLNDSEHGEIFRFTYHVSSYIIIFDVWRGSFGKIGNQKVCFAKEGSIEAMLNKASIKKWRKWKWIDLILLPFIVISIIASGAFFSSLVNRFIENSTWYITTGAFIVIAAYVILCLWYCIRYWRKHKYLTIWLKRTKAAMIKLQKG